jgi:hypothetical protein
MHLRVDTGSVDSTPPLFKYTEVLALLKYLTVEHTLHLSRSFNFDNRGTEFVQSLSHHTPTRFRHSATENKTAVGNVPSGAGRAKIALTAAMLHWER